MINVYAYKTPSSDPFVNEAEAVRDESQCQVTLTGCFPPCCGDNSIAFNIIIQSTTLNCSFPILGLHFTSSDTEQNDNSCHRVISSLNISRLESLLSSSSSFDLYRLLTADVLTQPHNLIYSLNTNVFNLEVFRGCLQNDVSGIISISDGANYIILKWA